MLPPPEDPLQAGRPTQVRWLIFSLAGAVSWLLYLHRYSWGVIKPAFRRENPGLTDTEVGWLDSAFNGGQILLADAVTRMGQLEAKIAVVG